MVYAAFNLYMRWFIYIPCRSEGQVLQGHLVYLGFIEQRALIPLTFIVALFPHWNSFAGIAPTVLWYQSHKWLPKTISVQCWIWLEPHLKLLMHDWKAQIVQSPPDHSPEWAFPICNEKPLKTDIPEHMQSKFVAQEMVWFCINFRTEKNGSYHARFTLGSR